MVAALECAESLTTVGLGCGKVETDSKEIIYLAIHVSFGDVTRANY